MSEVALYKEVEIPLPLWVGCGIMCPICGVISNPYPCYGEGETTAVPHRLSYCNHKVEDNLTKLAIWSEHQKL